MKVTLQFALVLLVVATTPAWALKGGAGGERAQTNRDIWVQPGEKSGDLSCFNCSIHVRGEATGDVAAIHGSVIVESGGAADGDVAAILGDVHVANGARIGGDVAAVGGRINRDPQGIIGGNQASFSGALLLLMVLIPIAVIALIVALIVWLIQRNRQPVARAA